MSEDLQSEIEVLRAVYGDENITYNDKLKRLTISLELGQVVRLEIPSDYPGVKPPKAVEGGVDDSEIISLFQPGEQILLQLVEAIREKTAESRSAKREEESRRQAHVDQAASSGSAKPTTLTNQQSVDEAEKEELDVSVAFVTGDTITANKSRFVGHAARCKSPQEARNLLHLIRGSKYARATHNIWSFRLADGKADNDDDGESAAGGRLAELLQLAKVQDIIVVVSRYYGGVNVGPQRFKYIMQAARSAIDMLLVAESGRVG